MPVYPVVDSRQLREVAKRVKEIEPQIRKDLINGLKGDLKPYAQAIADEVNSLDVPAKMSGWVHSGRTQWGKVRQSVHVTPGGGKGSVARIEIFGAGQNKAAFKIADRAGTRKNWGNGTLSNNGKRPTYTIRGQGEAMAAELSSIAPLSANGKGGRFAWAGFMKHRPRFVDMTIKALDRYADRAAGRITS